MFYDKTLLEKLIWLKRIKGGSVIPDDYKRVEYITTGGKSYFDTNIKVSKGWSVSGKVLLDDYDGYVYGNTSSNNTASVTHYVALTTPTSMVYHRWGDAKAAHRRADIPVNTPYTFLQNDNGFRINNVITPLDKEPNSFTSSYSVAVGTAKSGSSQYISNTIFSGRLYGFRIRKANGDLAFDGKPVKRKSDNVYGMYDTVSETFYVSRSTTPFGGA